MRLQVRARQGGVSLFVVMVMVLLVALFVVGAARVAWLHELITGTDADYQRAFANAQALLRDAQFDIQGLKPDGTPCKTGAEFEGSCRSHATGSLAAGKPSFPQQGGEEYDELRAALVGRTPSCLAGICVASNVGSEFWRDGQSKLGLEAMKRVAAHYGEFTGAKADAASQALLDSKGWYWVEVLPFGAGSQVKGGKADVSAPDLSNPYVYRITVVAEGLRPATRAVLQSVFVWKKVDS